MLSGLGFAVSSAVDGAEALQLMQSAPYDVVVIDQNMPHLGGLEAIRRFREWQKATFTRSISMYSETDSGKLEHKSMHTRSTSAMSEENVAVHRFSKEEPPSLAPNIDQYNPLIFMMSGSILDADRIEAKDLGISDYFEKPLHVKHVAAMILAHLIDSPNRLKRIQVAPTPTS